MKSKEELQEEIYKEWVRQYNKSYYQRNREKLLAKANERRKDEEYKKKRKEYRRKYYEMYGK